jgi:hypothetical protein
VRIFSREMGSGPLAHLVRATVALHPPCDCPQLRGRRIRTEPVETCLTRGPSRRHFRFVTLVILMFGGRGDE